MKRLGLVAAHLMVACMVPAGIYAAQNAPAPEDKAEAVALKFLKSSATFSFDGIPSSLTAAGVEPTGDGGYTVEVGFDCLHGGYGDRDGVIVTQAITPHTASVKVVDGKVVEATIDQKWDEVGQEAAGANVTPDAVPPLRPISAEEARDLAVRFIIGNYGVEAKPPTKWGFADLTPKGIVGAQTFEYSGGGWVVTVNYAVVMRPDYSVSVEYSGAPSFAWKGLVSNGGPVQEIDPLK